MATVPSIVRFATYENTPIRYSTPVRTIREKLNRMQRLLVWLCEKFGVVKAIYEESVKYESHTMDFDIVKDSVMKHRCNLEMISGGRAKYVIVGRDQIDKMRFHDMVVRHLGTMQFRLNQQIRDPHDHPAAPPRVREYYHDLEVIFVPYIDGCFVMPDVF